MPINNVAWIKPNPADAPKIRTPFGGGNEVAIADGVMPVVPSAETLPADPCLQFELNLNPDAPTPALFTFVVTNSAGASHTRNVVLSPGGSYSMPIHSEDPAELFVVSNLTLSQGQTESYDPSATGTYFYNYFGATIAA